MNQRSTLWMDLLWIFFFSFILRLVLILKNPAVYAYDAYLYLLGISSQYPLFTGLIKLLIACDFSVLMIRMVTAAAGSCACMAVYLFCDALFVRKCVSRTTAFLMSIYPPFLTFSLVPYTEPFFFLMFFMGLWCFEREADKDKGTYAASGIFLGLACLIRYEGCLMLPLILCKVFMERPAFFKHPLRMIRIFITLFWGPIFLFFYNRWTMPDLFAAQSGEIGDIFWKLVPLISGIFTSFADQAVPEIMNRGLVLPVLTLLSGIVLAGIGCVHALVRIKGTHRVYVVFIVLAAAIQFLPLVAGYQDYSGKIVGLRRLGMVPVVFLICYFTYTIDMFIQQWGKRLINRAILLGIILIPPVWMSCNAVHYILSDYQKLYRRSFIEPCWIGQSDPFEAGMITSVTDRVLALHLAAKKLRQYPARQFAALPTAEMASFIDQKSIKYVLIGRKFIPVFETFLKKSENIKFRRVAVVGHWLFVFVRE